MNITFNDGLVLDAQDVELQKSWEREKAYQEELENIRNKKKNEYEQEKEYLNRLKQQSENNMQGVTLEPKSVTDLQKISEGIIETRAKLLKNEVNLSYKEAMGLITLENLYFTITKPEQEIISKMYNEKIPNIANAIIDLFDNRNDDVYKNQTVVGLRIKSNKKCLVAVEYFSDDEEYAYIGNVSGLREVDNELQKKIEQLEILLMDFDGTAPYLLIHIYFQEYFSKYFFTKFCGASSNKELFIYIRTSEIYKIMRANEGKTDFIS